MSAERDLARRPDSLPAIPAAPRNRLGALELAGAGAVTLLALGVYLRTIYPTVPFWDAGEFIATSYILGIPHQPSTPLYVLIGRLATLVPAGTIAFRVNMLSAISTAATVLFAYLAVLHLVGRMGHARGPAIVGGLVAGILTAFSRTIWFNALETEVYALSGMMVAISIWAILSWADGREERRDTRVLLVIFYLLSLSIGIHLGTYLVLPGLVVLVILERPAGLLTSRDLLVWLVAFPVVGLVLSAIAGRLGLGAGGDAFALLAAALLCLAAVEDRRFAGALVALFLLGVSVHLFLPIRSRLGPFINEGQPDNWQAFWDTLTRAQYPAPDVLVRRAPLGFQFDHMFLRYVREQWPVIPGVLGGLLFPLLALGGAVAEARRDRHGFWMMLVLALVAGPLMVLYLNFTANEVRERDYFFTLFYQVAALWAGLGAATVAAIAAGGARRAISSPVRLVVAGALLVLLALVPLSRMWFEHDRRHDWIARDYAYNLLVPLPRDAILLTNGDNDTFPLWYLQEVEGIRRDVRVVNLSLLNTPWYLKQIRDYEPQVPLGLSNAQIAALRPIYDEAARRVIYVKDLAVQAILAAAPPERPLYLAVTVPDLMGLDERLTMEGLARRIHPGPTAVRVDVETCRRNLDEVFTPLRGILTPSGETDTSLFRDENETRLLQNYAAISFYLAVEYDRQGNLEDALAQSERALQISPGFSGNRLFLGILIEKTGDVVRAEAHYREALRLYPDDARFTNRLGLVLAAQGKIAEAVPMLRRAMVLGGPGYFDPYAGLFEIYYQVGHVDSAVAVLDAWLNGHPNDAEVREIRDRAAHGEMPPGM